MEKPCLNDKNEYPDDAVLSHYLGKVKKTWDSFIDFINENYPSFSGQWRYYNDGQKRKKPYHGSPFTITSLRQRFIFLIRRKN